MHSIGSYEWWDSELIKAQSNKKSARIDGGLYSIGNGKKSDKFLGMAGRKFDIRELATGKEITTYDLWGGGEYPKELQEKYPDTHEFLNGAGAVRNSEGEVYCWNSSREY